MGATGRQSFHLSDVPLLFRAWLLSQANPSDLGVMTQPRVQAHA